jgi:hypothetical protein
MHRSRSTRILLGAALAVMIARPALAGPPLVCFPFDIGTARSLPWDAQGHAWKGMRANYRVAELTGDTLALLTPASPVIVRMETLRRAALYATTDATAARALLTTLLDRAAAKGAEPIALFDAGYLVETYKQLAPFAPATAALASGIDGYRLVAKSLAARPHDPALEFAAAMITSDGRHGAHEAHVRFARSGASGDPLLARNLERLHP